MKHTLIIHIFIKDEFLTQDVIIMETNVTMTGTQTHSSFQSGLGNRLKAARESLHLSEKDAAANLHLNVKMIPIMENEDFENGPPATFMRGYLRSYARMLNISEHEVNDAISQLEASIPRTPEPVAPPILNTRSSANASYRYVRLMTYVIISVLILLVSMWWSAHSKDFKLSLKSVATTAPVENANPTPAAVEPVAPPVVAAPVIPIPAPAPQASAPAAPVAPNTTTPAPENNAVTQSAKAPATADDLDMSLSDPALEQNENSDDNNQN
jgi:cytoskeleton protein RodZ